MRHAAATRALFVQTWAANEDGRVRRVVRRELLVDELAGSAPGESIAAATSGFVATHTPRRPSQRRETSAVVTHQRADAASAAGNSSVTKRSGSRHDQVDDVR